MIEEVAITDHTPIDWRKKFNPLWWLQGPNGWDVPDVNNGAPYLPGWPYAVRLFVWFFCRNPLMNFVGFVLGAEDRNYFAYGPVPVLATTLRDAPPATGWKWSIIVTGLSAPALIVALVAAAISGFWSSWFLPVTIIAALKAVGDLPFVSYWGPIGFGWNLEFYLGWRPTSGGFGLKFIPTRKTS